MRQGAEKATVTALGMVALFLCAGLVGCVPWPEYGTGGLAERQETSSPEVIELEGRYQALVDAGGMRVAAGRMIETNLLLTRARREFAAGMTEDGLQSAAQVDRLLLMLERDIRPARGKARFRTGS